MTKTIVLDAYRALLSIAGQGRGYRRDEVYFDPDMQLNDEIVGKGLDLTRELTINLDGTEIKATAALRLLALTNGNLSIRVWLDWESPYGEHRAYSWYNLSPEQISMLPDRESDDEALIELVEISPEEFFGDLSGAFEELDELGAQWDHYYPEEPTNEVAEHHTTFIKAALEQEPLFLTTVSPDNLGEADKQDLIDLHEWLRAQPEVAVKA